MSNLGDVELKLRFGVRKEVRQAFINAVAKVFVGKIKSDAQHNSPRDTGNNANTIDVSVKDGGAIGVVAQIYTQSGYGGYLELGHKVRGDSGNMVEGRPYIYPAVMDNMDEIREITKENLGTIK